LEDAPRSGRPPEIDGKLRAKITALACNEAPEGHAKWSLRLLAEKVVEEEYCEEISHTHIGRILKKLTLNSGVVHPRFFGAMKISNVCTNVAMS
jgi:hypothetical protein